MKVEIDTLEKMEQPVIVLRVGKALTAMASFIVFFKKKSLEKLMDVMIVCTSDSVCNSLVPTGSNGTCYRGGLTVFENHQMCNVTSKCVGHILLMTTLSHIYILYRS